MDSDTPTRRAFWALRFITEVCVGFSEGNPRLFLLFLFRCCRSLRYPWGKLFIACGIISICSATCARFYCPDPIPNADSAVFHTMEGNACLGLLSAQIAAL